MNRWSLAALTLLAASLMPLTASGAGGADDPTDAVGNVRAAQAPYVQPADHRGHIIASDFSLMAQVSCPSESIDVMEFREGDSAIAHKSPGSYHAADVAVCGDKRTMKPLLDWFSAIKNGSQANFRRDLVLEILGTGLSGKQTVTCKFNLSRVWPHQVNWAPDGTVCVQLAVEFTNLVDQ